MSDLLFPCSGDACLAGESDHSSQQNKQAYRDFGSLQDIFLGSGCKGDPGTLVQTVGLHSNGGVLTRVSVQPRHGLDMRSWVPHIFRGRMLLPRAHICCFIWSRVERSDGGLTCERRQLDCETSGRRSRRFV